MKTFLKRFAWLCLSSLGVALPVSAIAFTPMPAAATLTDAFGYQIDEQSYVWMEAPSNKTHLQFPNADDGFVEVTLPFDFPFYENTYSSLYVSTNGLIRFGTGSTSFNNAPIPRLAEPNNFIAVFWDDLAVGGDYNSGKVFAFEDANQFVIEWKDVSRAVDQENFLTFEAVFSPDGTICLQYQSLSGILDEATVGIEDADGVSGLQVLHNEPGAAGWVGSKAICLVRPGPARRVKLLPPYQSGLVNSRQIDFPLGIKNTGDLGDDRYEISALSRAPGWQVQFLAGETLLPDEDHDGKPEIGVAPGATEEITIRALAPSAPPGNYTQIDLTVESTNDLNGRAQAMLQAAVPPRFVQFFADDARGLYLHWIAENTLSESQVEADFTGSAMAMGEGKGGFYPLVWEVNGTGYAALAYQVFSVEGKKLFAQPRMVTTHAENSFIFDREPSVAQSEAGRVGMVWVRNQSFVTEEEFTANIYFLQFDQQGNSIGSPQNITKQSGQPISNLDRYSSPHLCGLQNPEAWLLVWEKTPAASGRREIQSVVIDSAGNAGTVQTLLADAQTSYSQPALVCLEGQQALLLYTEQAGSSNTLKGVLLQQDGALSGPSFAIGQGWRADGVRLENGDVIVAWTDDTRGQTNVRRLQSPSFTPIGEAALELRVPYELRKTENVSITAVSSDSVVVTWKDAEEDDYLYYAFLTVAAQGEGGLEVLTSPMIFYAGAGLFPKVLISAGGQGNAPFPPAPLYLPLILRQ